MSPIALGSSERAALAMERAALLLGERFDGATVALVPGQIENGPAWRESVRALDRMARSPRVRLAVYAPPGGPLDDTLGEEGARFHVDQAELTAFLAEQGGAAGEEPAKEGGPGTAIGPTLRALLLAAAASTTAREHATAARRYEEAAALCASEGRVLEEAMARMGKGGACLAAEAPELAATSYGKAAALAEGEEAWPLACQAWLGAGGALSPARSVRARRRRLSRSRGRGEAGGDRAAAHPGPAHGGHVSPASRTRRRRDARAGGGGAVRRRDGERGPRSERDRRSVNDQTRPRVQAETRR